MKALELLYYAEKYNSHITEKMIDKAIEELEDMCNRSCETCKHYLSENGNYPLSCMECSEFYESKWEAK